MDFAAQLKKLSAQCEFGTFLDGALRDRFVCGLRKESIQRKLLGEKTLDFSKALQIAQSMEMGEKKSSELKDSGSSGMLKTEEVHRLGERLANPRHFSKDKGEKSKTACYRCGNTKHNSSECKYKKCRCEACGKVGHLKKVCRSKESKDVRYIETASNCDEMHDSFGFFTIRERDTQATTVTTTVEGKELVLEVQAPRRKLILGLCYLYVEKRKCM